MQLKSGWLVFSLYIGVNRQRRTPFLDVSWAAVPDRWYAPVLPQFCRGLTFNPTMQS